MSRYKCWNCKQDHGTDNVVAVCVHCFSESERKLKEAEAKAQKNLADQLVAEHERDEARRLLAESEAGAADKDKCITELKREVDKLSSVICCKCGPVFRQGNVNERHRHF